jgi:hypothetical protein
MPGRLRATGNADRQTRSGVAGTSMCLTPNSASVASRYAQRRALGRRAKDPRMPSRPSIKFFDRDIRAFIRAGNLTAEKRDDPKGSRISYTKFLDFMAER